MVKFSPREIKMFIILSIVLVLFIYYQALYAPKVASNSALVSKINSLTIDLQVAQTKLKTLDLLRKTNYELEAKDKQVTKVYNHTLWFFGRKNIYLTSFKPTIGSTNAIKIDINCQGSYKDLYTYLSSLKKLRLPLQVDSLVLQVIGPIMNSSIGITTYY